MWEEPAVFHHKGRSPAFGSGLRARLGNRLDPLPPTLRYATRSPREIVAEVQQPRARLRWRYWIFVTVHDASGRFLCKRLMTAKKASRVLIPLPPVEPGPVVLRASSFNPVRRRSQVVSRQLDLVAGSDKSAEAWSQSVRRRFHHCLIENLMQEGAASIDDLFRRRLNLLDLAMTREEIEWAVESARRHGLIEPLGGGPLGEGKKTEWVPTDQGRLRARRFGEMTSGIAGKLPWAFAAGVLAIVAKKYDVLGHWAVLAVVLGMLSFLILAGASLAVRRSQGALPRRVAREWDRHAVELPDLNRWYGRRFRVLPYILTALAMIAILPATFAILPNSAEGTLSEAAILPTSFLLGLVYSSILAYISIDLGRTAALRREAREAIDLPSR
jgi:hypothetical protein